MENEDFHLIFSAEAAAEYSRETRGVDFFDGRLGLFLAGGMCTIFQAPIPTNHPSTHHVYFGKHPSSKGNNAGEIFGCRSLDRLCLLVNHSRIGFDNSGNPFSLVEELPIKSFVFYRHARSIVDGSPGGLFVSSNEKKSPAPPGPKSRMASLILGLILALIFAGFRILISGSLMQGRFMGEVPAFTQSLNLAPPWNIIASVSALLAYGPGEAIFVVYLVLGFDKALGGSQRLFSRGVIITSILWALPHLFNIFYFGLGAIANALIMFFLGLLMGILLKRTRSSLGPIIFWTLVNGTSM